MDYITAQTPDKGVQIGPEPPISNGSIALTPDKGVQIGPELLITNASTALTPDKGVQIGPEPPIDNYNIAMAPDKGVQIGKELPISNDSIAMTSDTIPGFAGNLIEAGIVLNGTKSAVYESTAYPANADGTQRPGAVVEYSSEFSVGEGFSVGGVKSELPAGYLAAEFLQNENNSYMNLPIAFNTTGNKIEIEFVAYFTQNYEQSACEGHQNLHYGGWDNNYYVFEGMGIVRATGSLPYFEWVNYKMSVHNLVVTFYTPSEEKTLTASKEVSVPSWMLWKYADKGRYIRCRRKNYIFKINGEKIIDLIPAIDGLGHPCFFDKKSKQSFYNEETTPLIVGLTLPQALQLRKLPSTGGTLTISLPEGYDSDANVMAALETARSKGWTLTIQTYTPENIPETASTFALRRIWVRKTQDEQGGYVDADGSRWQVDWCVDMITPDGSTPDAYGYEMFRNVDAAVAYWELTPYVDPEAEKEFSQEL